MGKNNAFLIKRQLLSQTGFTADGKWAQKLFSESPFAEIKDNSPLTLLGGDLASWLTLLQNTW